MEHCDAEMQKNDMTHKLLQAKNIKNMNEMTRDKISLRILCSDSINYWQ